ncbi:M23 family metallopeptidase [Streptomyces clavuligerus]|uniref:Peptidase n=1 Tax=Streptomyces clavuligerus TaxID=1901 RepID=B5H3H9_STRCL|nr:M23 family metallopeptidase [Streptomyces clavuligerus]ANW19705.1 peptidase [Streptomyces clavuligerus]AXU14318.1 M23 family peptidase [Streptomyces clavuligerus]EDY53125.1 peptidase [Streptomyces clavuligerus]EFG07454.1 Peptidase [Streptomyces clavuligerus]MBY6304322.1 M23 family metallopeptidase [Streptomyces clavuligerus]
MSRFTIRRPRLADLRTRSALLAAGAGAVAMVGAGAAFAAESGSTAPATTSQAVAAQAQAQSKAAEAKTVSAPAAKPAAASASGWSKPVDQYTLSATYGKAGGMWTSNHSGQDFAVPSGTPVKSVGPGTVVKAGPNGGGDGPAYGNAVVIKHSNNTYSQYAHLSTIGVSVGQQVSGGQQIALSGNTGNSSGPHLHFEIRTTPNYGSAVDPVAHLRAQGITL